MDLLQESSFFKIFEIFLDCLEDFFAEEEKEYEFYEEEVEEFNCVISEIFVFFSDYLILECEVQEDFFWDEGFLVGFKRSLGVGYEEFFVKDFFVKDFLEVVNGVFS